MILFLVGIILTACMVVEFILECAVAGILFILYLATRRFIKWIIATADDIVSVLWSWIKQSFRWMKQRFSRNR